MPIYGRPISLCAVYNKWRLPKQDLGFPWVVRKVMLKYGSQSTDIIRQTGSAVRITSVNAKGSWTREMIENKETTQVLHVCVVQEPCNFPRGIS